MKIAQVVIWLQNENLQSCNCSYQANKSTVLKIYVLVPVFLKIGILPKDFDAKYFNHLKA